MKIRSQEKPVYNHVRLFAHVSKNVSRFERFCQVRRASPNL
jgi:hypothetical protein